MFNVSQPSSKKPNRLALILSQLLQSRRDHAGLLDPNIVKFINDNQYPGSTLC